MIKCLCSNLPPSAKIVTIEELSRAQRAEGPANVLAIGTANPSNCIDQSTYPDYFFRITNSEHKSELKRKFKQMSQKAINEWGQPISKITHLIFCTTNDVNMPGADYQLIKILGLDQSVKRFMLYQQGCSGVGTALQLAKDLAKNNKGTITIIDDYLTLSPELGTQKLGKAQGVYVSSSADGTTQMMAFTAMMEGGEYGDSLNFFGSL
ncbi:hypothetical protein MTR67_050141 [Solanum verrucosum]|uniref:chalcone synthase n=1 Tax=Solanum verrucosum TaxID=315347 RepID=A0AAF0V4S3_SOLVR|nr:hypothetical protein MTR67_050141 [Solanum verrucosum]